MQYKFKYTYLYKLPFLLIYQYNKAVFTYHSKHITMSYLKKIFTLIPQHYNLTLFISS